MEDKTTRTFIPLDTEYICEHKRGKICVYRDIQLHNHDGYEIILFLSGKTAFYNEMDGKTLERGDIILVPPYAYHGVVLEDVAHYERVVINFTKKYLNKIGEDKAELKKIFYQDVAGKINYLHVCEDQIQEFLVLVHKTRKACEEKRTGSNILRLAYFMELFVLLMRCADKREVYGHENIMPEIVSKTFSYIEEHVQEDISVDMLARHLHHNSDYLSRCFHRVAGISLQQFIIAKKMTLAQKFLSEGKLPSDTCYAVGYHNYSNFSRIFSKYIGMSPKQYQIRNQHIEIMERNT